MPPPPVGAPDCLVDELPVWLPLGDSGSPAEGDVPESQAIRDFGPSPHSAAGKFVDDEVEFRRLSNNEDDRAIEIDAPEFERRAREYSVAEFQGFYGSDAFLENYQYDEGTRLIHYVPISA